MAIPATTRPAASAMSAAPRPARRAIIGSANPASPAPIGMAAWRIPNAKPNLGCPVNEPDMPLMMPILGAAALIPEITRRAPIQMNWPWRVHSAASEIVPAVTSRPTTLTNRSEVRSAMYPQAITAIAAATPARPKSNPMVAVSKPAVRWIAGPSAGSPSCSADIAAWAKTEAIRTTQVLRLGGATKLVCRE